MSETISLGTCPTCGGPAQFIKTDRAVCVKPVPRLVDELEKALCISEEQYRDLQRQLAEKQAEIEAMRLVVRECENYWRVVSSASASWRERSNAIDSLHTQLRAHESRKKP